MSALPKSLAGAAEDAGEGAGAGAAAAVAEVVGAGAGAGAVVASLPSTTVVTMTLAWAFVETDEVVAAGVWPLIKIVVTPSRTVTM